MFAVAILLVMGGCSTAPEAASTPTTVDPAAPLLAPGELTVRIGTVVNASAPTAELDQRLTNVMRQAAGLPLPGAAVSVEVTTIDEVDDVASSVAALAGRGVTVIATLCDDATVPGIVNTAIDQGLLAITACVTLPTPEIDSRSPMFIDLAGMHDAGRAIAQWAAEEGAEGVATIRSDLVPDVAESCSSIEGGLADVGVALDLSLTYTELVDDPDEALEEAATRLAATDAVVVCALPPAAGDMVAALRDAGLDQPIMLPWFADEQSWPSTTDGVHVLSPASRHGDDPVDAVAELFELLGDSAQAVDVVAADSIALLSDAAVRARSTGSSRLAEMLRTDAAGAVSGEDLSVDEVGSVTGRDYRVIDVTDGRSAFDELVRAAS